MMICFSLEKIKQVTVSFLFLSVLFFISGCTKLEQTTLGGDLIPGGDKLITDTMLLPVETTSFIEADTSIVEKTDQHIVGFITDPLFGTTSGTVFLQTLPVSYPFSLPTTKDSLFLDSLVLSLSYSGMYGDTNAVTKVNVYKIQDPDFKSIKRYTVHEGASYFTSDFLGTKSFKAREVSTGYKLAFKGDSVYNQLRIRLSDQLGQSLLEQNNITGAFQNDSLFKVFLNGFAIVPDSTTSGNALHYFSLSNADTRLSLYYRVRKSDGTLDTTVTNFPFVADTIRSANANKIHRNYQGSIAGPHITSGLPSSLAYIQTAPGTAVNVKVKGLDTLTGKQYIIHRAELVARQIYQGPLDLENSLTPPLTHLYTLNSTGQNAIIPYDSASYFSLASYDFIRQVFLYNISTAYTGGNANYFTNTSGNVVAEYRLNMTRFVQNIVNGKTQRRDFKLAAPYYAEFEGGKISLNSLNPIAYGRVQLGGGSHPQYPMFVRIYYSKQ